MQVEVNFRTQGHTYSRQQPSILFGRTRTAPPYFTEIIPRELYISNLEGACDLINLHAKGITHIVSVLKTRCSDECSKSIQRLWLPIVDSAAKVREFESLWPEALKFLRDCRKSHGTALVHCRAGMSRSSTVVLAHLMEYDCLSLRDAWNLLKGLHEIASPITPFFISLINFERYLQHKRSEIPFSQTIPSMVLSEYQKQMASFLFPSVPFTEFFHVVEECHGNWLSAARLFHTRNPEALRSFKMRFGGGASDFHPLCDIIAEQRNDDPAEFFPSIMRGDKLSMFRSNLSKIKAKGSIKSEKREIHREASSLRDTTTQILLANDVSATEKE